MLYLGLVLPRNNLNSYYFALFCNTTLGLWVSTGNVITFMWLKIVKLFLQESIAPNPLAKEELNFLARLLGGMETKKPSDPEAGFRLNLFATEEEEEYVLNPFF